MDVLHFDIPFGMVLAYIIVVSERKVSECISITVMKEKAPMSTPIGKGRIGKHEFSLVLETNKDLLIKDVKDGLGGSVTLPVCISTTEGKAVFMVYLRNPLAKGEKVRGTEKTEL